MANSHLHSQMTVMLFMIWSLCLILKHYLLWYGLTHWKWLSKRFFSPLLKVMTSAERKLKQMPFPDTLTQGESTCKGKIEKCRIFIPSKPSVMRIYWSYLYISNTPCSGRQSKPIGCLYLSVELHADKKPCWTLSELPLLWPDTECFITCTARGWHWKLVLYTLFVTAVKC